MSDLPPSISSASPLWSLWDPCGLITLPLRGEAHNPKSIHSSFYSLFCFVLFLVFFLPGPSQACGKGENGGGGLSGAPPSRLITGISQRTRSPAIDRLPVQCIVGVFFFDMIELSQMAVFFGQGGRGGDAGLVLLNARRA